MYFLVGGIRYVVVLGRCIRSLRFIDKSRDRIGLSDVDRSRIRLFVF